MEANTGPILRARNRHSQEKRLCGLKNTLLGTVTLVQGITIAPPLTHHQGCQSVVLSNQCGRGAPRVPLCTLFMCCLII